MSQNYALCLLTAQARYKKIVTLFEKIKDEIIEERNTIIQDVKIDGWTKSLPHKF